MLDNSQKFRHNFNTSNLPWSHTQQQRAPIDPSFVLCRNLGLICPLPKHIHDIKGNNGNNKMENKHKNLIFPVFPLTYPKLKILFRKHKTIYKYL